MQITVSPGTATSLKAAALVVPVFADGKLDGAAEAIDRELGGAIAELFSAGETKGKTNEVVLLHAKDLAVKRILAVGLGERNTFDDGDAGQDKWRMKAGSGSCSARRGRSQPQRHGSTNRHCFVCWNRSLLHKVPALSVYP